MLVAVAREVVGSSMPLPPAIHLPLLSLSALEVVATTSCAELPASGGGDHRY